MNPHLNSGGLLNLRFLGSLVLTLFFILILAYFFYGLQPNEINAELARFQIIKGEGIKEIGAQLSSRNLIKSISVFKFYTLLSGNVQKFQPGVYQLSKSMSVPQIVNILTTGVQQDITVVIPEGSTLKEINDLLSEAGIVSLQDISNFPIQIVIDDYSFLADQNSLEGFLFPDTYRFKMNSSAETAIKRMLDNFKIKAWSLLSEEPEMYWRLILASFLEREVPDFNERRLVAGIILKRLRVDMPLQIDATISYAKCDGNIKACSSPIINRNDLSLPSLYNTYQRLGWTPTPISNPGQAAIKAALSPQESPYWFYLSASETGETIFSKTLEEHNLNRVKYL